MANENATKEALREAVQALWDVQGTLELLRREQTIDEAATPPFIASAVRIIRHRVDSAIAATERAI